MRLLGLSQHFFSVVREDNGRVCSHQKDSRTWIASLEFGCQETSCTAIKSKPSVDWLFPPESLPEPVLTLIAETLCALENNVPGSIFSGPHLSQVKAWRHLSGTHASGAGECLSQCVVASSPSPLWPSFTVEVIAIVDAILRGNCNQSNSNLWQNGNQDCQSPYPL